MAWCAGLAGSCPNAMVSMKCLAISFCDHPGDTRSPANPSNAARGDALRHGGEPTAIRTPILVPTHQSVGRHSCSQWAPQWLGASWEKVRGVRSLASGISHDSGRRGIAHEHSAKKRPAVACGAQFYSASKQPAPRVLPLLTHEVWHHCTPERWGRAPPVARPIVAQERRPARNKNAATAPSCASRTPLQTLCYVILFSKVAHICTSIVYHHRMQPARLRAVCRSRDADGDGLNNCFLSG